MTTSNNANVLYVKYTSGNLTTSKRNTGISNPAYNGTVRDRNSSAAGRHRFIVVLEFWMYEDSTFSRLSVSSSSKTSVIST